MFGGASMPFTDKWFFTSKRRFLKELLFTLKFVDFTKKHHPQDGSYAVDLSLFRRVRQSVFQLPSRVQPLSVRDT
jgi:hypothetical protein